MQAVLEQPGAATRSFWKGGKDSDYMMRAERRPGGYGSSSQRKRKKKPKKHIVYAIITVLLLLVLWPVGLIMLWMPKLRWKGYIKFILSIVTFFVFMALLSLALYAPTDNQQIQNIQKKGLEVMDTVEDYGTMAMDGLLDGSEKAVESIREGWGLAVNVGLSKALEGAEWVNDKAELAWEGIDLAKHKINGTTPEPTAEPTATPDATATAEVVTGTPNPDQTPVPAVPTVDATAEPTAEPTPTATPEPTPAPTPSATLKPASQATVYHTTNGGWYHMAETCKNMSNAKPFTLQSSVDGGLLNCRTCAAPAAEMLEAEYVVWVDEQNCFHTGDECEFFQGKYTLMTLDDAVLAGMTACMDCGANQYVPFATVTAAPTVEPGAELTEEQLMELAKDVTVYYSNGSRYYHTTGQCQTMQHGSAHTMYEALTTNHEWCSVCQPPKLEDLPLEQ